MLILVMMGEITNFLPNMLSFFRSLFLIVLCVGLFFWRWSIELEPPTFTTANLKFNNILNHNPGQTHHLQIKHHELERGPTFIEVPWENQIGLDHFSSKIICQCWTDGYCRYNIELQQSSALLYFLFSEVHIHNFIWLIEHVLYLRSFFTFLRNPISTDHNHFLR